jgi:hypothetical protein
MTTTPAPELTTFRWSSHDEDDRFPVEDPATGEVITIVQGGGGAQVNAAVEAAHRAFQTDWRWRTPAERAALLLEVAGEVLQEHQRRPGGAAGAEPPVGVADAVGGLDRQVLGGQLADRRRCLSLSHLRFGLCGWRASSHRVGGGLDQVGDRAGVRDQ